jgi:hypothetical protein
MAGGAAWRVTAACSPRGLLGDGNLPARPWAAVLRDLKRGLPMSLKVDDGDPRAGADNQCDRVTENS